MSTPREAVTYQSKNVTIDDMNALFEFLYDRKQLMSEFNISEMTSAVVDYLNLERCVHCGRHDDPHADYR